MKNVTIMYNFTNEEWQTCLKVLKELKINPLENPDNKTFSGLVTKIYKNARKIRKYESNLNEKSEDLALIKDTVISKNALNNTTVYFDNNKVNEKKYSELNKSKHCYCCNISYKMIHFFYNRMCPECAELNYEKRFLSVNLKGKNALITGGRVKIGYATALKLLKSGANVTVTSRFPALALDNFRKEPDYNTWKNSLTVYGLDLKNLKEVESFVHFFKENNSQLDILINNAAQTIKYTDDYYLPIVHNEQRLLENHKNESKLIPNNSSVLTTSKLIEIQEEYIDFELNRFGQPLDNRMKTSWNSTLEEVSVYELLEVNLINHISPYILIKELKPLFKNSKDSKKFIINVTSSEGNFSYSNKTIFHPHTNMTKAALNMLTKTSAKQFEKENILMYAVDVGWISTGAKEELRKVQFEKGYIPPLDSVDGASRIIHPIVESINENPILVGTLLKNYKIEPW